MTTVNPRSGAIEVSTNIPRGPGDDNRIITFVLDLTTGPQAVQYDLSIDVQQKKISSVKAIWLDNSVNTKPVSISVSDTGQLIVCPPQSQGWYPVLASLVPKITFASVNPSAAFTGAFCSFPMPPFVWKVT